MVKQSSLDSMFHPKTIAVVGASRKRSENQGWLGMFGQIKQFGFPGRLYPINPKASEIEGLKAYPNLVSLPEPVDLVIITVPAPAVPDALRDCVASGNRNIHIFTAGFNETGEAEGADLYREIEDMAINGGLRVVGPNCMGLYVPKERVVTWGHASKTSGTVAFISQSGGHAEDFTRYVAQKGIYFSKVISFGNALTLDCTDFLRYLADDPETEIITMYLEGVKDGHELMMLVREINKTKPVIVLKGGLTESGARAAASHTGSMAGGESLWNALYRQTGAIRADSLEEMADILLAFHNLDPIRGRRVTVIGTGGGVSVAAADACSRTGLVLPPFDEKMLRELRGFIPPAGNMIRNPIDAEILFMDPKQLGRVLDLVSEASSTDMIILAPHFDWFMEFREGQLIMKLADLLIDRKKGQNRCKPLVVGWRSYRRDPYATKIINTFEQALLEAGIPVYQGLPRAASALAKWAGYDAFLNGMNLPG
jgi:acyl-CoA synthetase (NDP forming)